MRGAFDYDEGTRCERYEYLRNDPDGVWTLYLYQFPGSGRQYPLRPGHTAVVATDAIDHTPFAETAVDLSEAEFEFIGSGDPDNPAAANLVSVGPVSCCPSLDGVRHGLYYQTLDDIAILSDPVDLATLPRERLGSYDRWRLPAEKILEVATGRTTVNYGTPPCPRMVNERFDRGPAVILEPH
jgi:hypothetical protein